MAEETHAHPDLSRSMRRHRRIGFCALLVAGLSAGLVLLGSAGALSLPGGFMVFGAALALWSLVAAGYALRRSGKLSELTIQRLEGSAMRRLERQAGTAPEGHGEDYLYLKTRLEEEQARIERHGGVMGLLYLKVLGLEEVREEFGRRVCEEVLEETREIIASRLQQFDVLGRLGDGEFVALLPQADRPDARSLAEGLQEAIGGYRFQLPGGGVVDCVRSAIGVSAYPLNGENAEMAVAAARRCSEGLQGRPEGGVAVSEEFISEGEPGRPTAS